MTFTINEKVFYPGHGVATIEDVIEKTVSGNVISFFKLQFDYKDMTILIPVSNSGTTGVRYLSSPEDIDGILGAVEDSEMHVTLHEIDMTPSGWNKRNKDYHARFQAGSFMDILSVYKDLMSIGQQKDLSFGEKNMLHVAEELLAQEIMTVKELDHGSAMQLLRAPFKQFLISYTSINSPHSTSL